MNYLPIDEFKIQASVLLKSLRKGNSDYAARFKKLPEFSAMSLPEILSKKTEIKLKHALKVIAVENGYDNWAHFKHSIESKAGGYDREILGRIRSGGFLNNWYATYEEAKQCLDKKGRYLLVYKHHFFVCERGYIEALGLDPEDPDWELIGYDWEKPKSQEAWDRLYKKLLGNK